MQMVIKLLGTILVALVAIVVFAPKRELYYALEHEWERSGIVIADETITEGPNSLKVEHARLLYQGAPIATVDRAIVRTWLVFSILEIEGIKPLPGMEKLLPITLDKARATHVLWYPTVVTLELNGSFGRAEGELDLLQRRLKLKSPDAGKVEAIRPYLKNDERSWIYEYRF